VPRVVIAHLAKQLGIAAPSVWPAIAKESKPTTRMPLRFSAEWGYTREAAIRPSNTRVLGERSTRSDRKRLLAICFGGTWLRVTQHLGMKGERTPTS
jgi:hypothetical protein